MTSHAPTTRERVIAYDLLRVFAAMTVVTIHVTAPYMKSNPSLSPTSLVHVFDMSLHYAVPLFTFLSGALSWGALWVAGPGRYRAFMYRRWLVVGVPYVAWSIFYYLLRPASGMAIPHNLVRAAKQFAILLLSGTAYYHLYFLPMVLILYLFTPLASKAAHRAPEIFVAAVYLAAVFVGPWLFKGLALLSQQSTFVQIVGPLLGNFVTYGPFMALGAWYAVRQREVGRALRWLSLPLLALGVALTAYQVRAQIQPDPWYYWLSMSVMILGFLGVASYGAEQPWLASSSNRADRVVALASLTLGVYLIHPVVITFGERKLVEMAGYASLWRYLAMAIVFDVVAIIVSFGVAALLKRWKVTRRFV